MTWERAREGCESRGGRLAVSRNDADHAQMQQLASDTLEGAIVSRGANWLAGLAPAPVSRIARSAATSASALLTTTAWTGLRAEAHDGTRSDRAFEYRWEGEPGLDNVARGNKYGSSFYFSDDQQFSDDKRQCGVMERLVWNRRDCDTKLPYLCEHVGRCEVCRPD